MTKTLKKFRRTFVEVIKGKKKRTAEFAHKRVLVKLEKRLENSKKLLAIFKHFKVVASNAKKNGKGRNSVSEFGITKIAEKNNETDIEKVKRLMDLAFELK